VRSWLTRPSLLASSNSHCRLKQTSYGKNAFEAFRNCARVDFIEDMSAFPFGLDDLRSVAARHGGIAGPL
jgi:hypothetical protein